MGDRVSRWGAVIRDGAPQGAPIPGEEEPSMRTHLQQPSARLLAICLGILFAKMNVNFLVGWAFNIAASANLPALVMLLFWKRTTKQGITAAIIVGMISSLAWILLSAQAYKDVYGLDPARAIVP